MNNGAGLKSNARLKGNFKEYALIMKALADETRVRIFHMLSAGELCACRILESFDITQPTLSYHMRIMCESGLVIGRRDGVWMRYSINKDKLQAVLEMFNSMMRR